MAARAVQTLAIVISIVMAGSPESSRAAAARLGESFTLGVGESTRVEDTDLTVSFDEVSSDSRCPVDVNCIQAGEALVQLALRSGEGERTVIELTVPPGGSSPPKRFGSFLITVVELNPQKVSDQSVEPSAYVATIRISRA
jgi:hypothetical protein